MSCQPYTLLLLLVLHHHLIWRFLSGKHCFVMHCIVSNHIVFHSFDAFYRTNFALQCIIRLSIVSCYIAFQSLGDFFDAPKCIIWQSIACNIMSFHQHSISFLALTGALVVAPLPLFHRTSSRSSKALYDLLTLLNFFEHLCLYI